MNSIQYIATHDDDPRFLREFMFTHKTVFDCTPIAGPNLINDRQFMYELSCIMRANNLVKVPEL